MKIVVLGWGSLIWDPQSLDACRIWEEDGPYLPIEFARISSDSRLTLVIEQNSLPIQVLWTYMTSENLDQARENLRLREKTPNISRIGFVDIEKKNHSSNYSGIVDVVSKWAEEKQIDAVIWTDLGVKFKDVINKKLNHENIINYLKNLPPEEKKKAKEYIVNTPEQIKTLYRKGIENELNWKKTKKHRTWFKAAIASICRLLRLH